jgi:hypothetical protein
VRRLALAFMHLFFLVAPILLWSAPVHSASYCTQADFVVRDHPEQQEALCLQSLKHSATRRGNVLTLKLDDGSFKTYRNNPAACDKDDANNCVHYYLVGFNEVARLYIILIWWYENFDCVFVSAQNGAETEIGGDLPHFAPDELTFVALFAADGFAIGSVAGVTPSITRVDWPDDSEGEHWKFQAWIDLDHVALRYDGQSVLCPDGNCEATLVRTDKGWILQRKL